MAYYENHALCKVHFYTLFYISVWGEGIPDYGNRQVGGCERRGLGRRWGCRGIVDMVGGDHWSGVVELHATDRAHSPSPHRPLRLYTRANHRRGVRTVLSVAPTVPADRAEQFRVLLPPPPSEKFACVDMGKIACNRNRVAATVRQPSHYALTRSELLARISKMVSICLFFFSLIFLFPFTHEIVSQNTHHGADPNVVRYVYWSECAFLFNCTWNYIKIKYRQLFLSILPAKYILRKCT